jgi:4-hydroxybenzoate polyprenyltransferase
MVTAGPVLNESSDLLEDKKFGVKSLSTILSWERKVQLMIAGVLVLMTVIPLIQLQHGVNIVIPVISVGISLVLLRLLYPLTKQFEEGKISRAKRFGKIYLFLFQLSFVFSAL